MSYRALYIFFPKWRRCMPQTGFPLILRPWYVTHQGCLSPRIYRIPYRDIRLCAWPRKGLVDLASPGFPIRSPAPTGLFGSEYRFYPKPVRIHTYLLRRYVARIPVTRTLSAISSETAHLGGCDVERPCNFK